MFITRRQLFSLVSAAVAQRAVAAAQARSLKPARRLVLVTTGGIRQQKVGPEQTWVVTSNKQLTANIGPGANVILSKQLMIEAVERIINGQTSRQKLEREQILQEMTAVLETDYERIGWGVPANSTFQ